MIILVVIGIALIGKLFDFLRKLIPLGKFDKILGGVFGFLKLALLTGILLNWLNTVTFMLPVFDEEQKEISMLYKPTKNMANVVFPKIINKLEDLRFLEQNQRETQEKEIQDQEYYKSKNR